MIKIQRKINFFPIIAALLFKHYNAYEKMGDSNGWVCWDLYMSYANISINLRMAIQTCFPTKSSDFICRSRMIKINFKCSLVYITSLDFYTILILTNIPSW